MNELNQKIEKSKHKIEFFTNQLRRFWLLIIICGIIGGAIGGVISRVLYTPEYTVTQSFSVRLEKHPELSNSVSINESQLAKTLPNLLSSNTFSEYMQPIIKNENVVGKFKVTSLNSTNLFYLTVVSNSNKNAIKIIELIQENYSEIAEKVIGESELVYFTSPATSMLPSNAPHYTTSIVIGAVLGLLLVLAYLVFKTIITKTITDIYDAEKLMKSKCLATFKTVSIKQRSNSKNKQKYKMPLITSENCELDILQSVSSLGSNTNRICAESGLKSILMTSTISGEGKSSISVNLALELALKGHRTVIVDADLRTPSVADYLEVGQLNGDLSKVIENKEKLETAITKGNVENLFILGDNATNDKAFDNTTSKSFNKIIKELESQFNYVIVDAPPVGILGDAISISDAVDGYIYVVSQNYISKNFLLRSLSSLDDSKAKMIGFVINYKK